MNRSHRLHSSVLTASLFGLLLFSGCLENPSVDNPVDVPEEPVPCTASALCRLQNPADTIGLSSAQKSMILTRFEMLSDTTVYALSRVHLDSLDTTIVRFKLLNDLHVTIGSVLFRVTDTLSADSTIVIDWRGSIASPDYGFVDLTFHDGEFESGFVVRGQKYITLISLGDSRVLVEYEPMSIWMGECPVINPSPLKTSAVQLTCPNVIP